MKNILFLTCMLLGFANMTQAQTITAYFNNYTASNYFDAVFFTTPISGCPTTPAIDYYHHIPNNHQYSTNDVMDENGAQVTLTDLSGICLQLGANAYVVSFCSGGTPTTSGYQFLPNGNLVTWGITSNSVTISIY